MLDPYPDPQEINADPKPCFNVKGLIRIYLGSTGTALDADPDLENDRDPQEYT
jgi:hypothetical protein